jgi:hypothetical protein
MRLKYLILFTLLVMITCETTQNRATNENKVDIPIEEPEDSYSEKNYEAKNPNRYELYLVAIENYTTNGDVYHRKHKQYLLGIAEILTEKYSYKIKNNTIGFYYDKVENRKDNLYLGLDIVSDQSKLVSGEGYFESGRRMINEYLKDVLDTVHRYEVILGENEVNGAVVGLLWYRNGRGELINVWLAKQNINEYFNNQLTFNELILKATITDNNGKKIRLTM